MQQLVYPTTVRHSGGHQVPCIANLARRVSPSTICFVGNKQLAVCSSRHAAVNAFSTRRLALAPATVKRPLRIEAISTQSSEGEFSLNTRKLAKKVITVIVSAAIAVGLSTVIQSGIALASPHIALPAAAVSPIVQNKGREVLVSAWMGLMAGCLHTLTGPDHLAALAPLSIGRTKLESVAVGALWGCGHDAGQVIFGILFLLLKDKLHIEVLRTWGARVVGITLLTIGALGIKEAQEAAVVPCLAGDASCVPTDMLPATTPMARQKKNLNFATFATGIVHGLQPDALIMILPALALPSRFAGGAFLVMFLIGTIIAMSGYTVFIGSCSNALEKKLPRITEHLSWFSSLVAIFVGVAILASEVLGISIF